MAITDGPFGQTLSVIGGVLTLLNSEQGKRLEGELLDFAERRARENGVTVDQLEQNRKNAPKPVEPAED